MDEARIEAWQEEAQIGREIFATRREVMEALILNAERAVSFAQDVTRL